MVQSSVWYHKEVIEMDNSDDCKTLVDVLNIMYTFLTRVPKVPEAKTNRTQK